LSYPLDVYISTRYEVHAEMYVDAGKHIAN